LPDKYVQSNYESINAVKLGIQKSNFQGRDDTTKLIEALEGLEMKAGPDFPQGDKTLRKEDHQAFPQEFIFEVSGGTYHLKETVPGAKTIVPPACNFTA
jgi:branched-chain amino acid transport system substrate-binding protein